MDPWPSDLISTCKLWASQNKLASIIGTESHVRWLANFVLDKFTAFISKTSRPAHQLTGRIYIQHFREIPHDSSLLSTQRGRPNQCLWSEERTDSALSVASPTHTLLIAVTNAPQRHLEAICAIQEPARQWRSVLLCGRRTARGGAVNALAELMEGYRAAVVRREWCNHKRCCFQGWGFSAGGKKKKKQVWRRVSERHPHCCVCDHSWGNYPSGHQNAECGKAATML